jgi:CRISPR-associated endoribonuclease Cas6
MELILYELYVQVTMKKELHFNGIFKDNKSKDNKSKDNKSKDNKSKDNKSKDNKSKDNKSKDNEFNDNSFNAIYNLLLKPITNDSFLKDLHNNDKGIKLYSVSGLFPTEKNKYYKKDKNYTFLIRSFNKNIITKFEKELKCIKSNEHFRDIKAGFRALKNSRVNILLELYTPTPVIVTLPNDKYPKDRYWTVKDTNGNAELFREMIENNLKRKYEAITGTQVPREHSFIQQFKIVSQNPQFLTVMSSGKKLQFLGYKVSITPQTDEVSQNMAFVALGTGLGEKNSFCGGFCNAEVIMENSL